MKAASSKAAEGSWPSWPSSSDSCCSQRLRSPDNLLSRSAHTHTTLHGKLCDNSTFVLCMTVTGSSSPMHQTGCH